MLPSADEVHGINDWRSTEPLFSKFRFIEERVLFLLILLGGDRRVLHDWTAGGYSGLYTRASKTAYFGRGPLDCKTEEQRHLLPHLTTSVEYPEERPRVLAGYSVLDGSQLLWDHASCRHSFSGDSSRRRSSTCSMYKCIPRHTGRQGLPLARHHGAYHFICCAERTVVVR